MVTALPPTGPLSLIAPFRVTVPVKLASVASEPLPLMSLAIVNAVSVRANCKIPWLTMGPVVLPRSPVAVLLPTRKVPAVMVVGPV